LSTRLSRSSRRALVAIGCWVGIYGVSITAFGALATWAEVHAHAHPYELGEEMFRILLPSIAGRPGRDRMMLIGSSTAQEALLYEEFDAAFPGIDAYQVSYSVATIDEHGSAILKQGGSAPATSVAPIRFRQSRWPSGRRT